MLHKESTKQNLFEKRSESESIANAYPLCSNPVLVGSLQWLAMLFRIESKLRANAIQAHKLQKLKEQLNNRTFKGVHQILNVLMNQKRATGHQLEIP